MRLLGEHALEVEHESEAHPPLAGGLRAPRLDLGERAVERVAQRGSGAEHARGILFRAQEGLSCPGFCSKGRGLDAVGRLRNHGRLRECLVQCARHAIRQPPLQVKLARNPTSRADSERIPDPWGLCRARAQRRKPGDGAGGRPARALSSRLFSPRGSRPRPDRRRRRSGPAPPVGGSPGARRRSGRRALVRVRLPSALRRRAARSVPPRGASGASS